MRNDGMSFAILVRSVFRVTRLPRNMNVRAAIHDAQKLTVNSEDAILSRRPPHHLIASPPLYRRV